MKEYTYVSVVYDDDIVAKTINESSFYYLTDLDDIEINDKVLVNRNGKDVVGIVVDVEIYDENNVPFPVDRTKKIIKVLEKAEPIEEKKKDSFFIDPFDEYMLIIHDSIDVFEELELYRSFIINKSSTNTKELIDKCNIIVTVGNVDITKYDLSKKYVININNEINKGEYTLISYFSKKDDYIQMIKAIHYGLFYTGLITLDLYDVENSLNGRIEYKRFSLKDKNKIFKKFEANKCKKIFIVFEAPTNSSLYEICDIVDEFRDNYENSEIDFAVPVIAEADELIMNIFYDGSSVVCPNCGKKMLDIVYGMPAPETIEKAKRGELFLGGCMIKDNQPEYHCNICRRSYSKDLKTYIEEANNWENEIINIFEPKKIDKDDFLKLKEDDVMFITNPGRMGDEDGTTFVIQNGNEFSVYRVDGWMYPSKKENSDNIITMAETANQFPKWLEAWKHGNEKDYKGKYTYIYMGFGNGLSVDNNIYEEYKPYLDKEVNKYLDKCDEKEKMKYAAIFNVWDKAFVNMADDKEYIIK